MIEILKKQWFVVLIAVILISFAIFSIWDTNKGKLAGKKADGKDVIASVADKNIFVDDIFNDLKTQSADAYLYQKFQDAVANEVIETDDDIKSTAKLQQEQTEEYFKAPVFVKDWPKDIKAFYMKLNPDNKTVAAVDLLVPGSGELMGGSQREENYTKLKKRMEELHMKEEGLEWYMNLRKYGGCIHSGFGMGFERLIIYLTGVDNIRDVIPFPRTPGNCEY